MESRAAIAFERRRMMSVRRAFETGLAGVVGDAGARTDFFLATSAYILFSMDRLHFQDHMIHDLLRQRIPEQDRQAHRRLAELETTQRRSRELVDSFGLAADRLRQAGPDGLGDFEDAARAFTNTAQSLMAPRKNPFQAYTDRLFTSEDWLLIAATTDESLLAEQNLYQAVRLCALAGCEPDDSQVVYH